MNTGLLKTWLALSADSARLAFEAQQVIALRMMKIAAGGAAAQAEITRMFSEKAFAGGEAAADGCDRRLGAQGRARLPHAREGERAPAVAPAPEVARMK